jgi:hypothetical protein
VLKKSLFLPEEAGSTHFFDTSRDRFTANGSLRLLGDVMSIDIVPLSGAHADQNISFGLKH